MADQVVVGRLGVIATRVRGQERPGEVRIVMGGVPHILLAFCPNPLERGQEVLIVADRGARRVDVEPWPDRLQVG